MGSRSWSALIPLESERKLPHFDYLISAFSLAVQRSEGPIILTYGHRRLMSHGLLQPPKIGLPFITRTCSPLCSVCFLSQRSVPHLRSLARYAPEKDE